MSAACLVQRLLSLGANFDPAVLLWGGGEGLDWWGDMVCVCVCV